jgi:hypothetical protein
MRDYGEINSRADSHNVPRPRQEFFSTKVLLTGTRVLSESFQVPKSALRHASAVGVGFSRRGREAAFASFARSLESAENRITRDRGGDA